LRESYFHAGSSAYGGTAKIANRVIRPFFLNTLGPVGKKKALEQYDQEPGELAMVGATSATRQS
jgi:hypothetical protein